MKMLIKQKERMSSFFLVIESWKTKDLKSEQWNEMKTKLWGRDKRNGQTLLNECVQCQMLKFIYLLTYWDFLEIPYLFNFIHSFKHTWCSVKYFFCLSYCLSQRSILPWRTSCNKDWSKFWNLAVKVIWLVHIFVCCCKEVLKESATASVE